MNAYRPVFNKGEITVITTVYNNANRTLVNPTHKVYLFTTLWWYGQRSTVHPYRTVKFTNNVFSLKAGTPVLALVESALGIENATAIASAPGTFRLAFGVGDFRRDTGASDDPMALAYARSKLVVASRVGQLPGPIDGPTVGALGDELLQASKVTASMGMTGKLCLSPDATDTINRALSPSESEIQWAVELLSAHAAGAVVGDGSYLPRLARAQKISSLADSYGLWNA